MLQFLDGKISMGATDKLDFDKDLPRIDGVKEGLYQYYEIEKTTDTWTLCTEKTQAKIGVNEKEIEETFIEYNMVVFDYGMK